MYFNNIYDNKEETEKQENINIDEMLEMEKQNNKGESWNKLDKTMKIQKLHSYAEKYGKENSLSQPKIRDLKKFFADCLERNKLSKTKEVIYDKEKLEIQSIPQLHLNKETKNFTLKQLEKRLSTIKSLTPKKTIKNKDEEKN